MKRAYQCGFANHFSSEATPGSLPQGQNSPQQPAQGLYAEQLNGSAFTAPRQQTLLSWLYRIKPSVLTEEFCPYTHPHIPVTTQHPVNPTAMRWDPLPIPEDATDFIDGLYAMVSNSSLQHHQGGTIYHYACNQSMQQRYFYNADGELLIIPQQGALSLRTEFGILDLMPEEIAVIPRGIKFAVDLLEQDSRGYVVENAGQPFQLPELGPIGANGLANRRDFLYPTAHFEELNSECILLNKFHNQLWRTKLDHSPLDVVAWHGNYAPYKYALANFNTMNTVSFDHADPSIFTVLSSPSNTPGVANMDFVIFPPRWLVAEHTFRPPYYHRNCMSEYMGLLKGQYDAKQQGFQPGGSSLHNRMTPHGPDAQAFAQASTEKLTPHYLNDSLAFMLESTYIWQATTFAVNCPQRQQNYLSCWQGLKKQL